MEKRIITNIKMAYRCHAVELLLPRNKFITALRNSLCITLLLLTSSNWANAQSKKSIGVPDRYKTELEKRLNPPLANNKKAQLFFQFTYDPLPERSLRLIDAGNNSFLEVRILNRNLNGSLSIYSGSCKSKTDVIIVSYFRVKVSHKFRNSMLSCFQKVLRIKVPDMMGTARVYDGMYFYYRLNANGNWQSKVINWELDGKSFEHMVSITNLQIIDDIVQTRSFSESKYPIYNVK